MRDHRVPVGVKIILERNDSGSFFAALGDQLVTGPTGHNLNDLRVIASN